MDRKNTAPIPVVGLSSLLVIFAVLCLTVFALLCISTAQADIRLADRTEAAVTGYYRADCQAERILAQLRVGQIPPQVSRENGIYSYACAISDTQVLAVEVAADDYTVLRWQAVSTALWQTNENLPVWQGS